MRWRRRLVRLTKWLSAAGLALLIAAWLATLVGWFQWVPSVGRYLVCNSRGSLIIDWIPGYHGRPEVYWIPHHNGVGLRFGRYVGSHRGGASGSDHWTHVIRLVIHLNP